MSNNKNEEWTLPPEVVDQIISWVIEIDLAERISAKFFIRFVKKMDPTFNDNNSSVEKSKKCRDVYNQMKKEVYHLDDKLDATNGQHDQNIELEYMKTFLFLMYQVEISNRSTDDFEIKIIEEVIEYMKCEGSYEEVDVETAYKCWIDQKKKELLANHSKITHEYVKNILGYDPNFCEELFQSMLANF